MRRHTASEARLDKIKCVFLISKKMQMKRSLFYFSVLSITLSSCFKNMPSRAYPYSSPSYPTFYGHWKYVGSSIIANVLGPWVVPPSADLAVVLMLNPDNSYWTTLNDRLYSEGTYTIDSTWNPVYLITFNNIVKPYGNDTAGVSGNVTYRYFNYTKIGQLSLCQINETMLPLDTLVLTTPIVAPEVGSSFFERIP